MRLYPHFLTDGTERDLAISFWRDLLEPTAITFGWQSPWLTTMPDDGANIYSVWKADRARGFTVDQMSPGDCQLDAFCDIFDKDNMAIDFLRIGTDGSVGNLPVICRLATLWMGTNMTKEDMESLLLRVLRGEQSALLR